MRIGQLALATGVSTDTIRYYEKIGLLPRPQRTASGYREYPSGAGNRIQVIRNAVQLGFPLDEIAKALRVRDAGGAPCRQVRDYAHALVQQIEERIDQLTAERRSMLAMIDAWDGKLAQARGERAHLLEDGPLAARLAAPKHLRLRKPRKARSARHG
jgi:MerR family copper efflux transcriptional regulator